MNRRISKTLGSGTDRRTIWFIYGDEGLLAEINQNGQQTRTYGWEPNSHWGTRLLWQAEHTPSPQTTTYHYIHNDHLGTPQVATDHTGKQTWAMISEAFGKTTVFASGTEINIRFPGQYYDQETSLHYNFHRDYNPALGRYMQSDPIGLEGGENFYAYVKGNPVAEIDSDGLNPAAGAMAGGMVGGPAGAAAGAIIGSTIGVITYLCYEYDQVERCKERCVKKHEEDYSKCVSKYPTWPEDKKGFYYATCLQKAAEKLDKCLRACDGKF